MECPVCYEACANLKLGCNHSMCFKCTREWLVKCKSDEKPGCPMCRAPIRFKGLHKIERALEEERMNSQYSEAYTELFEYLLEAFQVANEVMPELSDLWQKGLKAELRDFETTFGVLKNFYYLDPEEIVDEIQEGVILNPKKEKKLWNKEQWSCRDKFASKHTRARVMHKHR